MFGVLTVDTPEQAFARCGDGTDNKGYESGLGVLEMIRLRQLLVEAGEAAEETDR